MDLRDLPINFTRFLLYVSASILIDGTVALAKGIMMLSAAGLALFAIFTAFALAVTAGSHEPQMFAAFLANTTDSVLIVAILFFASRTLHSAFSHISRNYLHLI